MYQSLQLTIPLLPPSANHYTRPCVYRGRDGQTHRGKMLTAEAKAFHQAVAIFVQGRRMVDSKAYRITLTVHLGYKQRGDLMNFEKVMTDSLQYAGVFPNDSRVMEYKLIMGERDWENPRSEVLIEVLQPTKGTNGRKKRNVPRRGVREDVQEQRGPVLAHGDDARPNNGWRAFASGQYRRATSKECPPARLPRHDALTRGEEESGDHKGGDDGS